MPFKNVWYSWAAGQLRGPHGKTWIISDYLAMYVSENVNHPSMTFVFGSWQRSLNFYDLQFYVTVWTSFSKITSCCVGHQLCSSTIKRPWTVFTVAVAASYAHCGVTGPLWRHIPLCWLKWAEFLTSSSDVRI